MANNLTFKEVPIVTRYFPEASSINFRRSVKYGFGILNVLRRYALHKVGWKPWPQVFPKGLQRVGDELTQKASARSETPQP
jgi:hypothetical protein